METGWRRVDHQSFGLTLFGSTGTGLAVLRVVVGIVFLMHGGQKLFIYGFHNVGSFMHQLGIPLPQR